MELFWKGRGERRKEKGERKKERKKKKKKQEKRKGKGKEKKKKRKGKGREEGERGEKEKKKKGKEKKKRKRRAHTEFYLARCLHNIGLLDLAYVRIYIYKLTHSCTPRLSTPSHSNLTTTQTQLLPPDIAGFNSSHNFESLRCPKSSLLASRFKPSATSGATDSTFNLGGARAPHPSNQVSSGGCGTEFVMTRYSRWPSAHALASRPAAGPLSSPCVQKAYTRRAPCRLHCAAASQSVPAVSTMSSTRMTSCPSIEPTKSILSICDAALLCGGGGVRCCITSEQEHVGHTINICDAPLSLADSNGVLCIA